jgi:uncharacterized protein YqeY
LHLIVEVFKTSGICYTVGEMSVKEQIDADLKTAMLAGEKTLVTTLRGLKAAILNVEVAEGVRDTGLTDDKIIVLLQKEAKKRQESADLYNQGNRSELADKELIEKSVIEKYLPAQISEEELSVIVDSVITESGANNMQSMGQVIGAVKAKAGVSADGALVARLVKERLSQ